MVHLLVGSVCLVVPYAKQPIGLKGPVAMRVPVRFVAGRQVCGQTDG